MFEKTSIEALALFGAAPLFEQPLHVGRPNLGDLRQFYGRMEDVFERRWLTNNGPYVQEFENRISGVTEARHAVAVNNATIGLQIALKACGVTGSVIVPSFTFVATAHALCWLGLRPIFCDVAPGTHHIDPRKVERLIAPDTSAILGVHVWGEPCDIAALSRLARRRGLKLLFDAAHAFGCSYRKRMIGNFGSAEVFSFHATKFINAFEGGAICTNDDQIACRARQLRDFGFDAEDEIADVGTNGKMCEASAVMGLTNLEQMDRFIAANREHYLQYRRQLQGIPGLALYEFSEAEERNYQYVVVCIDDSRASLCRDDLMRILRAENVLARRYFHPGIHRLEPYCSRGTSCQLPETEKLSQQTLALPTGTAVNAEEINAICRLIRFAMQRGAEIRTRLLPAEVPSRVLESTAADLV